MVPKRTNRLTVRLSDDENREVKRRCDTTGVAPAVLARAALLDAVTESPGERVASLTLGDDRDAFLRALVELGKQGSNLNQMTRLCHQGRVPDDLADTLDACRREVVDVRHLILRVLDEAAS